MIKKIFLLCILASAALTGSAQSAPGSWKAIPVTGTDVMTVTDTPEKVYFTLGTPIPIYGKKFLHSYDKSTNETRYMSPGTTLSDVDIINTYYNPDGKYMVITYSNGNIDLVYDSGKVVNLPEIKNSSITSSKNINTVKFGAGNRIYVGTDFGLVVYDADNHVVVESGIYNKPLKFVLPLGDKLLIRHPETYELCWAPLSGRHNTLDSFTSIQGIGIDDWEAIDDNNLFALLNGKTYHITLFKGADGKYAANIVAKADVPGAKVLAPTSTGWSTLGTDRLFFLNRDGSLKSSVALNNDFSKGAAAAWNEAKSVWHGNGDGLGCFDLSGTTPVVLSERFRPQGSVQLSTLHTSRANGKLYFHPETMTGYIAAMNSYFDTPVVLESYDWNTGEITKCYPEVDPKDQLSKEGTQTAQKYGSRLLQSGGSDIVADPVVDGLVYVMTIWDGVLGMKDGKVVFRFDITNSPIETGCWKAYGSWLDFDNQGNLWIAERNHYNESSPSTMTPGPLKVMKKEALDRLRNNFNAPTSLADWYSTSAMPEGFIGELNTRMVFLPNGKALYMAGNYNGRVYGYDTKNTTPVSDDASCQYTGFRDQDGLVTFPTFKTALVKDKNDWIWIGTSAGVYVVKDTDQITTSGQKDLNTIRPKVARNDGTNYADYLLSAETIYGIAVDANNNKWIATAGSGIYMVNPDGTETLKHFTVDNSPLMSNTVYAVDCNPDGNDVFMATPDGQFVYSSDSAPTAEDLSDVYAYPNPVRPDYEGWITITGLMDNTLVKITDSQGHAVFQGTSEGGMLVWDGRDASGDRVHSGVYLVFASSGSDQSSAKAVTKIVVIK